MAGGIREISVPSYQFCCKPKATLKNKLKNFFFLKNIAIQNTE